MKFRPFFSGYGMALSAFFFATNSLAQDIRTTPLTFEEIGQYKVINDKIVGSEMLDLEVDVDESQVISVDLSSSNTGTYFNVSAIDSEEALFVGASEGPVADVTAPKTGRYVVRTYLVRSAARRGEETSFSIGIGINQPEFADSLAGGPDFWQVSGVGEWVTLNLRNGPSTRYSIIGKLRDGDSLENQGCRLTGSDRWCSVRVNSIGSTGWVAGQFLIESSKPMTPASLGNSPTGNGRPFDATSTVSCSTRPEKAQSECVAGVVWSGLGNAGVWIALEDGDELQILFENGVPVATSPGSEFEFDEIADVYVVNIGPARFEIPKAFIFGG